MADEAPISTIYIQNLQEHVKIETLTEALTTIFSQFGNVVEVVAKKNLRGKGQAFVVFEDPASLKDAVELVQGFELFDKPMRISVAKTRSDKTIELKGTTEELESHKRHRQAEKENRQAREAQEQSQKKRNADAAADSRPSKIAKPSGLKSTGVGASTVVPDEYLPPNKILFLQNVPDDYTVESLTQVFGRFEGFREIRMVPGRSGIAFVEYDGEPGAIAAKENTTGMSLGDKVIKVTYQRQ